MQDEIEIIEILTFKLENLFSKYILELYDRRLKCKASGDKIGDLLFKLMMNGLYGKFGQKQYPTKKIVNTEQLNYILKTNNYLHVINDINEKKVAPRFRVNPANEGHIEDINYLGE